MAYISFLLSVCLKHFTFNIFPWIVLVIIEKLHIGYFVFIQRGCTQLCCALHTQTHTKNKNKSYICLPTDWDTNVISCCLQTPKKCVGIPVIQHVTVEIWMWLVMFLIAYLYRTFLSSIITWSIFFFLQMWTFENKSLPTRHIHTQPNVTYWVTFT